MSTSDSELPWFQFSLRSLLLFVVFVAALCSLGVCTDWSVSAVIAIGALMGGGISRRRSGLVRGTLLASACAAIGAVTGVLFWFRLYGMPLRSVSPWFILAMKIAAIIESVIGGVIGGLAERPRSGQDRQQAPV